MKKIKAFKMSDSLASNINEYVEKNVKNAESVDIVQVLSGSSGVSGVVIILHDEKDS